MHLSTVCNIKATPLDLQAGLFVFAITSIRVRSRSNLLSVFAQRNRLRLRIIPLAPPHQLLTFTENFLYSYNGGANRHNA